MKILVTMTLIYAPKILFAKNIYTQLAIIPTVNIYTIFLKQFLAETFNSLGIVLRAILVIIYMLIMSLIINKNLDQLFVKNSWKKIIAQQVLIVYTNILKLFVKILKEDFVKKEKIAKIYINLNFLVEIT